MSMRFVLALLSALLGAPTLCAAGQAASSVGHYEPAPCAIEDLPDNWARENRIDCGWMIVPAHRDQPDRGALRLWVIRVGARGKSVEKGLPVIRPLGGPEPVYTWYLTAPRTAQFSLAHDVVFFDYRGLGRAEPKPACKVAPVTGTTTAERLQSKIAQYSECRRQVVEAGVDLAAINSHASAQDIVDIARALGYHRYYVRTESYGSVPVFDLIRARPSGLRAAVVNTPLPPNSTLTDTLSSFGELLALMQQDCNQDPLCRKRHPDMAGTLAKAMDRVDRERMVAGGRRLVPYDLFTGLYELALRTQTLGMLPLAIETAATGDAALVAKWLGVAQGWDFFLPEMTDPLALMRTTITCGDAMAGGQPMAPRIEAATRRFPHLAKAAAPVDAFDRLCAAWRPAAVAKSALAPAISDIPVLLVNARLDPVTPAVDARLAASTLSGATTIEHPGASHDLGFLDPCIIRIEAAFLADPEGPLDRSCADTFKPVTFALDGFDAYVNALER